jgi:hypothetical protein
MMIGVEFCFVLFRILLLFFSFWFVGSCYWSVPINARSDREEVHTAVMSAPKLPYNKDDKRQNNENVIVGTLRRIILVSLLHFSFGYALRAFDKSIPSTL